MVQQGAGSVDPSSQAFARGDARAVYRAILERRDMRHFAGGPVVGDTLRRLPLAAHHAPAGGGACGPGALCA
ncbi:Cob(II)yrinic acid a,c-diamide reductase [Acidovorax delafieldii 2AN]|uniref:Cob(II)yrinic acid a,c-diamide reductase n=1 Tax=Acidovorax delafieldii 2AN TaxID=573060 RepID=C5TC34_ACIDE|nr:Cob(II)yrinic acid a,c-diamide reductase [Acidovorax delafieldii 2AN]